MTFVKLLPNTFCGLSQLSLDVDDLLINNLIALINHRFTHYVSLMHKLVPLIVLLKELSVFLET